MRRLAWALCVFGLAGCDGDDTSPSTSTTAGAAGSTVSAGGAGASGGAGGAGTSAGGSGASAGAGGQGAAGAGGGSGGAATGGAGGTGGSASSTTGAGMNTPCTWGDDCGAGYYCFAPGCAAGECIQKPVPVGQSPDPDPVCGCDGITYWNADVAASQGMSVDSAGPCAMQIPCGPGSPCPGTLKCNRKVDSEAACSAQADGECLSVPISCPLDGPLGRACTNGQCELQCSLSQSQNPWYEDPTCQ